MNKNTRFILLFITILLFLPSLLFAEKNPFLFKKGNHGWSKDRQQEIVYNVFKNKTNIMFNKMFFLNNHLMIVGQEENEASLFKVNDQFDDVKKTSAGILLFQSQFNSAIIKKSSVIAVGFNKNIPISFRPWIARFTPKDKKLSNFTVTKNSIRSYIEKSIKINNIVPFSTDYIIAGYTSKKEGKINNSHTVTHAYVSSLSSKLATNWEKIIPIAYQDKILTLQSIGKNILVAGYTVIASQKQGILLILDSKGNLLHHVLFPAKDMNSINSLVKIKTGFLLVGTSINNNNTYATAMAINTKYAKVWQKHINAKPSSILALTKTANANYWLAGFTMKNKKKYPLLLLINEKGDVLQDTTLEGNSDFYLTDVIMHDKKLFAIGNQAAKKQTHALLVSINSK